jgi:hypothetical protein
MKDRIILDTNLTILLLVGLTNLAYIQHHKRLRQFDVEDFKILGGIIARFSQIQFIPNVLSETSNLVRYVSDPMRSEISGVLAAIVQGTQEEFIASRTAVVRPEYRWLGLTDAALLELASSGATLLTTGLGLYLSASQAGLSVVNFNHIREQRPDYQ